MTDNNFDPDQYTYPRPGTVAASLASKAQWHTEHPADHNGRTDVDAQQQADSAARWAAQNNVPATEPNASSRLAQMDPRHVAATEQHVADQLAAQNGAYTTEPPVNTGARVRNELRRALDASNTFNIDPK